MELMSEDSFTPVDSSILRKHLIFAAEIATLFSTAAFMLSVVLNNIIFSNWNINYLQVASPSDVLMGGLDLLFRSWPVLLGIFFGYETSLRPDRLSKVVLLLIGIAAVAGFFLNAYTRGINFFSLWREAVGIVIVGAIWYWSWGVFASASKVWDWTRLVGAAKLAFGCAVFYTLVSMTPGFWPAGTLFVAHDLHLPCARPIVLWSGSSAVIVECPDHRRIIRTDGQQFITPGPASDKSVAWITNFLRNH